MSDSNSNHVYSTMPSQKLSFSKKNKKWKEQCVEAICSMGGSGSANGKSSYERKQTNYDLVNSIIDENDFKYVLDPYGVGDADQKGKPAKMRDINL